MSFTTKTSTKSTFAGAQSEKAVQSVPPSTHRIERDQSGSSSMCGVASGTTCHTSMVGKNRTPKNAPNGQTTPDRTNATTNSPANMDKTSGNPRTQSTSRKPPHGMQNPATSASSTSNPTVNPTTEDSWTPVKVPTLHLTNSLMVGFFRYTNDSETHVVVPMLYADGRRKNYVYCAPWFTRSFAGKRMPPCTMHSEHNAIHCFNHMKNNCNGACGFPHVVCQPIAQPAKVVQPAQPTTQTATQTSQRFAPLATLPESAELKPEMFAPSAFPSLAPTASAPSAPKSKGSYAQATKQTTSKPTKPAKPAKPASASAKPATPSAKPAKKPIDRSKKNTAVCWDFARGKPCRKNCAFSHDPATRALANLKYRDAFDAMLKESWIDFQSIFEEIYRALRKGVKDLRTIHGIPLDATVSKHSFQLDLDIVILIEKEQIRTWHFASLVKVWYAAASIGRKQGYDHFVLFEDKDGERENQVWELGRRQLTCMKDDDYQRHQSCYGAIAEAIHALDVPPEIRDKHSSFFVIPKNSICMYGINCNNGAHYVHKVDLDRLSGLPVHEKDDVETASVCMELDASRRAYIGDLTQLIQNEARVSELAPVVPVEVAKLRAQQAQIDATRTALSTATQKKADLVAEVSKIENGVSILATILAEIEKKQKDAIGGPYVLSQKEVRNITALEKLTKNSPTRIAKLQADASVQAGLIKHLNATKTTQEKEFTALNRLANLATVASAPDVVTQRELNRLTTECDRLTEGLRQRMRTIERLNAIVANDRLRGTCPVASYNYPLLVDLPCMANTELVGNEVDLTDEFFKLSTALTVSEQKRDFAKCLAIALPTTQSESSSEVSIKPSPAKVERIDPALVEKTRFALSKKVLEELRELEEESEDLVSRNVYRDDVIACAKTTVQPAPAPRREPAPKATVALPDWDECTLVEAVVELKEETTSSKLAAPKVLPMIQMSCKAYHERVASLTRLIDELDAEIATLTRSVARHTNAIAEIKSARTQYVMVNTQSAHKKIALTLQQSLKKDVNYKLTGKTNAEKQVADIMESPRVVECNSRITEHKTLLEESQHHCKRLVIERRDIMSRLKELSKFQPNSALDTENYEADMASNNRFFALEIEKSADAPFSVFGGEDLEAVCDVIENMVEACAGEMNVPVEPLVEKVIPTKITIKVEQNSKGKTMTIVTGVLFMNLKAVCSVIKTKCATACAIKEYDIVANGNVSDRVRECLISSNIAVSGNITVSGATSATSDKAKDVSTGKTKSKDALDRGLCKGNGRKSDD